MCLFSSPRIFKCFLLVENESLDLGVDLQGQGHVNVLFLFTGNLKFSFFSLKEAVLVLKAFLLEKESLTRVRVFHLVRMIFFQLWTDFFSL